MRAVRLFSSLFRANTSSGIVLPMAITSAVVSLAVVGCGRGHNHFAIHPVEGQVCWKGKPLANAQVVFYWQGTSNAETVSPRAQTDLDGRFRLGTYKSADGAPEGDYSVTVVYYPPVKGTEGWAAGPNALPKKYASPTTTTLRAHVEAGANTLPPLILEASVDPRLTRAERR